MTDTPSGEQLERCPFCGYVGSERDVFQNERTNRSYVQCDACGARGPTDVSEEGAIAHWNQWTDNQPKD